MTSHKTASILSINANADGLHLRFHLHRRNIRREFYVGLTPHDFSSDFHSLVVILKQMAEIKGKLVHVCDNCIVCAI